MTTIAELPRLTIPMTVGTNEDWRSTWAYQDADGNTLPLDGLRLVLMLRKSAATQTAILVASNRSPDPEYALNGIILTGGPNGEVIGLAIPASSMGRVVPGVYVFEVQASGDGQRRTIADGPVTVVQGVVR